MRKCVICWFENIKRPFGLCMYVCMYSGMIILTQIREKCNVMWCVKWNKPNEDRLIMVLVPSSYEIQDGQNSATWVKPITVGTSRVCVSVQGAFHACLFNFCTSLALQLSCLDPLSGYPWKILTPSFITNGRLAQTKYSASAISVQNIELYAHYLLWSVCPLPKNIFFTLLYKLCRKTCYFIWGMNDNIHLFPSYVILKWHIMGTLQYISYQKRNKICSTLYYVKIWSFNSR
jgi:hypothetical protein